MQVNRYLTIFPAALVVNLIVFYYSVYWNNSEILRNSQLNSRPTKASNDPPQWLKNVSAGISAQISTLIERRFCDYNITNSCRLLGRQIPRLDQHFGSLLLNDYKVMRETTVLIVSFNWGSGFFVSPLIYSLYARYFADIRFCGPLTNSLDFSLDIAKYWPAEIAQAFIHLYLTYGEQDRATIMPNHGETIYLCLDSALKAVRQTRPDLKPTGFMIIHDDIQLNHWVLGEQMPDLLSRNYIMPWITMFDIETLNSCGIEELAFKPLDEKRTVNPENCSTTNPWTIYPEAYQRASQIFFAEWRRLAENGTSPFAECYEGLLNITIKENRAIGGLVDFYYLTLDAVELIIPLLRLAGRNSLFQEIAVQIIVHSCLHKSGTLGLIDDSGWSHYFRAGGGGALQRLNVWDLYDANHHVFAHPLKLADIVAGALGNDGHSLQEGSANLCLHCLARQYSQWMDMVTQ